MSLHAVELDKSVAVSTEMYDGAGRGRDLLLNPTAFLLS